MSQSVVLLAKVGAKRKTVAPNSTPHRTAHAVTRAMCCRFWFKGAWHFSSQLAPRYSILRRMFCAAHCSTRHKLHVQNISTRNLTEITHSHRWFARKMKSTMEYADFTGFMFKKEQVELNSRNRDCHKKNTLPADFKRNINFARVLMELQSKNVSGKYFLFACDVFRS